MGLPRPLEGREVVSAGGESCGAGHEVGPLGGNDTANGACSGGKWDRLSQASYNTAVAAIALLGHLRLEGLWMKDTMGFLFRRKKPRSV